MHRNNADLGGKNGFFGGFSYKKRLFCRFFIGKMGFSALFRGKTGVFSRERRAKINEIQQKNANFSHEKVC
jgi:hypothetical protein